MAVDCCDTKVEEEASRCGGAVESEDAKLRYKE